MEDVLVVVDMQKYFAAANKLSTVRNVNKTIKTFIQKNQTIIFLEFQDCGPTKKSIIDKVKNYDKAFFYSKYWDDGSTQVINHFKEHSLEINRIVLCGVNATACVQATFYGIIFKKEFKKKTFLLLPAINDWLYTKPLTEFFHKEYQIEAL